MIFNIGVIRTVKTERYFEVEAKDKEEAESKVLSLAQNVPFTPRESEINYEIKD